MDLFVFKRLLSLLRALSLYGVIAGLLFSCGEGIRLFPFPVQRSDSGAAVRPVDSDKIQYEENASRVEKNREKEGRDDRNASRDHDSAFLAFFVHAVCGIPAATDTPSGISAPSAFSSIQAASRLRGRAPPIS